MIPQRVEFDSTLDELVDVSLRMVKHTVTYCRTRRQWQWTVGVFAAGAFVVTSVGDNDVPSYAVLAFAGCAALGLGIAAGMVYGRYYDHRIRRQHLEVLDELYGGARVIHWEFEIRHEMLWTRSPHGEVTFPWSRLRQVRDIPGEIELWFDPGLAVVRDRGFSDLADRRAFLDAATQYLPPAKAV